MKARGGIVGYPNNLASFVPAHLLGPSDRISIEIRDNVVYTCGHCQLVVPNYIVVADSQSKIRFKACLICFLQRLEGQKAEKTFDMPGLLHIVSQAKHALVNPLSPVEIEQICQSLDEAAIYLKKQQ